MKFGFLLTGLLFASQMALTTTALNAAPYNANTKTPAPASKTSHSGSTEQHLTRLAGHMLHQVDLASQAIAKKDKQAALKDINQALSYHSQLAALAKANNLPTVVPLYSEFDVDSVLGPLQAKKSKQAANPSTVNVEHASGQYTFIGVDLDKAKRHLDAAKTALNNNNLESANDSLAAIGDELVMETVNQDLPLLDARENLALAEDAAKKAHYNEAATALKDASTALNKYAGQSSATHAEDARALSKTIESYSADIAQNHTGAADKIDGWWHQVNNWFTKQTTS